VKRKPMIRFIVPTRGPDTRAPNDDAMPAIYQNDDAILTSPREGSRRFLYSITPVFRHHPAIPRRLSPVFV